MNALEFKSETVVELFYQNKIYRVTSRTAISATIGGGVRALTVNVINLPVRGTLNGYQTWVIVATAFFISVVFVPPIPIATILI